MRLPALALVLTLVALAIGCSASSNQGSDVTTLPTLPSPRLAPLAPTQVPVVATLAPATPLPPTATLAAATPPPEPTPLPTFAEPPRPPVAPTAPVLPTTELNTEPTAEPTKAATTTPAPPPEPDLPLVHIGNATWQAELAATPAQRVRGLSGREELPAWTGMLFIFDAPQMLTFWMPDMLWIDANCQVFDVTLNAPIPLPGQSLSDLPRFSPSGLGQYVLEINAGEYEEADIQLGDTVVFAGAIASHYGC